jgi:ribosomal protein S18 acetylase RimI-like enzyme
MYLVGRDPLEGVLEYGMRLDEYRSTVHLAPRALLSDSAPMPDLRDVILRDATVADAPAVIELWQTCDLTRPWNDPLADFAQALGGPASMVLIAGHGEALAGSIMVGFDGHRGWVYYLAVAPDFRRHGLGRMLMDGAEAWLRTRGAPKIQLMVREDNHAALDFYEALGLERQKVVTLGKFLKE